MAKKNEESIWKKRDDIDIELEKEHTKSSIEAAKAAQIRKKNRIMAKQQIKRDGLHHSRIDNTAPGIIEESIEEKVIEAKKEFIERVEEITEKEPEPLQESVEQIISKDNKEMEEALAKAGLPPLKKPEPEIKQEWIDNFKADTGKNAIWNGVITQGFKEYMKEVYEIDL